MKKEIILGHLKIFVMTMFMGVALLYLVSLIPQASLEKNALDGRSNFYNKTYPLFRLTETDNYSTYIDNAMDEIMIDISYKLGDKDSDFLNPLAFSNMPQKDIRYGRYWHGYAVILRPMLLFMNKRSIMSTMAVIVGILFIILTVCLIKKRRYMTALALIAASYITYFGIILKCLEYMPCAIVTLGFSIYICLKDKISNKERCLIYFTAGIYVAYFDFLTFETLSLTLPLIIDLSVHKEFSFKEVFTACIEWILGYVSTFLFKFALLALFVGEKGTMAAKNKVLEKISISGVTVKESLISNFDMLRFSDAKALWVLLLILCVLVIYIMGNNQINNYYFVFIGLIPIIRMIVLKGHSTTHCMFTYHALYSTVMIVILLILSPIEYFISGKGTK